MNNTVFFHGLKRSGNHAVIEWILRNQPRLRHVNNAFAIEHDFRKPGFWKLPRNYYRFKLRTSREFDLFTRIFGRVLISFEDYPVGTQFFRAPPRHTTVVLIRSARNVFASRVRQALRSDSPSFPREMNLIMIRSMKVWEDQADYFESNHGKSNFVGIHFDLWLTDELYRKRTAQRLGFEEHSPPTPDRPDFGGGSSFSGTAPLASDEQFRLLDRASELQLEERRLLDQILGDNDLALASKKLEAFLERHRDTQ